jgi:hypothetical protein
MNNEPVAHFYPEGEGCTVYDIKFAWKVTGTTEPIPLYTHPANPKYDPETGEPLIDGYPLFSGLPPPPAKTLTDEEIHELANEHLRTQNQDGSKVVLGLEDFAKALMEKMRNE